MLTVTMLGRKLASVLCLLVGCSGSSLVDTGPPDAGGPDAATRDRGTTDGPRDATAGDSDTGRDAGSLDTVTADDGWVDATAPDAGTSTATAELLTFGADGKALSIRLQPPHVVSTWTNVGGRAVSVRSQDGEVFVLIAEPEPKVVIYRADGTRTESYPLPSNRPRDLEVYEGRIIVSFEGSANLLAIERATGVERRIDLASLDPGNGDPAPAMMARCDSRLFVQLRGVGFGAVAVVDLSNDTIVDTDPVTPGTQAVLLQNLPKFPMTANCASAELNVVEPVPLMRGNSSFEIVSLTDFSTRAPAWNAISGEYGAFVMTSSAAGFMIVHTEFGPAPSSHLNRFVGARQTPLFDTFAVEHSDALVYDAVGQRAFFADNCTDFCPPGQRSAVIVFGREANLPAVTVATPFAPVLLHVVETD